MDAYSNYQRLSLDEGAVRSVASAVPGLKWEVEKDPDKGGYKIKLRHVKSSKILWACGSDVVPEAELQSSLQVLDRIWKDSDVDYTQDEESLKASPHMRGVTSGTSSRIDAAKKPIKHTTDVDSVAVGKQVKFQESIKLDRLRSALRKGEVREDGMENNHG